VRSFRRRPSRRGDPRRGSSAGAAQRSAVAIAHTAVYLASDEAEFVHATVIDVDGGRVGVAAIAGYAAVSLVAPGIWFASG
jgi:hypothetical protein